MTLRDVEVRMEFIEDQLQEVLKKQKEMQFLMLRIEGGITAMKWTAAVIGFLFGFAECL
tara:strand:+ start:474 stop:650 length:177 start_codon:yes stop_codon:yes gene_type:complete